MRLDYCFCLKKTQQKQQPSRQNTLTNFHGLNSLLHSLVQSFLQEHLCIFEVSEEINELVSDICVLVRRKPAPWHFFKILKRYCSYASVHCSFLSFFKASMYAVLSLRRNLCIIDKIQQMLNKRHNF